MADLSRAAEAGPPPPVSAIALLSQGFAAIRARWPLALALWAAGALLSQAPRLIREAAGLRWALWSPAWFAQTLIAAALGGVLAALTLQLFLARDRDWLTPRRGFWICAGLVTAANLANSSLTLLSLAALARPAPGDLGSRLELTFGVQAATLGLQFVLDWIYARLLFWPIGALMGDPAMTPARSWRLMRGQVAGFAIAVILLVLPQFALDFGYAFFAFTMHLRPPFRPPWFWVIGAVLSPATTLMARAMATVLYRARSGARPLGDA